MGLSEKSLRNIISRETNKLQRQKDALETTEAAIAVFTEQLDMFLTPSSRTPEKPKAASGKS